MIYIQHLPLAAKASYLTKLELLSAQENPYAACNADKVEDDMTLWPPLECGPYWNVAPIGMWPPLECGPYWNMDTYSAILFNVREYILNKSSCNRKVLRTTISKAYLVKPEKSVNPCKPTCDKMLVANLLGCQASLLTAAVHLVHLSLSARGNLSPSFFST